MSRTLTTEPETVSIAEAAAREGVSRDTIRRLISSGQLPAHKVGPKLIRIRVADLESVRRPVTVSGGSVA